MKKPSVIRLSLTIYAALCCSWGQAETARTQDLPFDQALGEMIDLDVNVRIQKTKLTSAEFQVKAAEGAFTPQIYLQAQAGNGNIPTEIATTSSPIFRMYSANAKWNLFRSGADMATMRAANSDRETQITQLDDNYIQAEDKSARALIDLIEKAQEVEAYKRTEDSVRHFLEIANARYARSLLSKEEADKVAIDVANAEATRADAEILLNNARALVVSLLGHSRVKSDWPWLAKLDNANSAKALLAEESYKNAFESRPDLKAAQASLYAEDSRSSSLYRTMYPTVDFTYSLNETQVPGQSMSSWSTLATLTIPLWNGMHDYSAYRVQVETKNAAEHHLRQLERDIQSAVEAAQSNFQLARSQYIARIKNLSIARHILDQDAARFKIGRSDANELNLDLARANEADLLAIRGIESAHFAYMQLLHVFGHRVLLE